MSWLHEVTTRNSLDTLLDTIKEFDKLALYGALIKMGDNFERESYLKENLPQIYILSLYAMGRNEQIIQFKDSP